MVLDSGIRLQACSRSDKIMRYTDENSRRLLPAAVITHHSVRMSPGRTCRPSDITPDQKQSDRQQHRPVAAARPRQC